MVSRYRTREEERESARKFLTFLFPKEGSGWARATGVSICLVQFMIGFLFMLPFGILALRDIRRHPEKTGKGVAWLGIILGGIFYFIIVCDSFKVGLGFLIFAASVIAIAIAVDNS